MPIPGSRTGDLRAYRPPGYLPFFRLLFRDLFAFRRQGYGWRMSWRSALDYWRFDRSL